MNISNLAGVAGGAVGGVVAGPLGAMVGKAVGQAVGDSAQQEVGPAPQPAVAGGGALLNSAAQAFAGGGPRL